MIVIMSKKEIEMIREAGKIVVEVLERIGEKIEPGISTWDLEELADQICKKFKARPAFKNYRVGKHIFPACLCTSINEEVVHGIPSPKRVLKEGDIISVDFGVEKNGYYADAARTFPVGKIDELSQKLLDVTLQALKIGIEQMRPKNHLQDIGYAIQSYVEKNNFSVVRDFVGHGIGRQLHEDPQIPNYGMPGKGILLREGMVFAIEPMVNLGTHEVKVLPDGWTVITKDKKRSAHFEYTAAITENGPEILTPY